MTAVTRMRSSTSPAASSDSGCAPSAPPVDAGAEVWVGVAGAAAMAAPLAGTAALAAGVTALSGSRGGPGDGGGGEGEGGEGEGGGGEGGGERGGGGGSGGIEGAAAAEKEQPHPFGQPTSLDLQ